MNDNAQQKKLVPKQPYFITKHTTTQIQQQQSIRNKQEPEHEVSEKASNLRSCKNMATR